MCKVISLVRRLKRILFKTEHDKLLKEWFKAGGDTNFRLGHDLNEDSIVFDVGGYKGKFIDDVYSKFKCNVYSFEPVKEFFDCMKQYENEKINVYDFGLDRKTEWKIIYINEDESSIYGEGMQSFVRVVDIKEFIDEKNIDKIDLMEINIEGGEYDLLDYIIKEDIHKKIKNIQIQFHRNVEDYESRRKEIREQLSKTHEQTYNFDFIMENWRIKENSPETKEKKEIKK